MKVESRQSAWERYPDYRITLAPQPGTARVWAGDLLLAETTSAVRLVESKHVERLYIPESDVRLDLFEPSDLHTVCAFKGQASYWNLTATHPPEMNVLWTYRDPLPEVAGIKGLVCFYQERVRVEIEDRWPGDDPDARTVNAFPLWGDASDLLALMDVLPLGSGRFESPAHDLLKPTQWPVNDQAGDRSLTRNVIEGGQLLGEAIVAASKTIPGQRVVSAYATFPKIAHFDSPTELRVEVLRQGRTFSSVQVRIEQEGALCSACMLLLGEDSEDIIRSQIDMPSVPGPNESVPYDFRMTGRDLRVVDGAYDTRPHRVGPPEINAWVRFRDNPEEEYLRQALIAQATTHWTFGAAMRPHTGVIKGQHSEIDLSAGAVSHVDLSAGVMSVAIAFHDSAPLDEWFLYANPAIWSGRGLAQGEGLVFTEDGTLLASYSVRQMIREFARRPDSMGLNASNAM